MSKVDVNSNAEGLGVAKGIPVIGSLDVGDYQGQTLVFLDDDVNDTIHMYVIYYGSCGGCDWYEDFYGEDITYKDCLNQFGDTKPRFIYPKSELPSAEKLHSLLYEKGYQQFNEEYGWTIGAVRELLSKVEELKEDK